MGNNLRLNCGTLMHLTTRPRSSATDGTRMERRKTEKLRGGCLKRVETETVQNDNTDPTPLPHGSWNDDARGQ